MKHVVVIDDPNDWPFPLEGVEVCSAKSYLTETRMDPERGVRVYNLCKSYRYQTLGYYVSLLASARGHKPIPSVATIQELKSKGFTKSVSDDLDQLTQKCLQGVKGDDFVLRIYFGHSPCGDYDRLCAHLYSLFKAPLLRAHFRRTTTTESETRIGMTLDGSGASLSETPNIARWELTAIKPISHSQIPTQHYEFVQSSAKAYFAKKKVGHQRRAALQYGIAILIDPTDPDGPSNTEAIENFCKAALELGLDPEVITKDDFGRIGEFDALFIRETTSVKHHTFRFAQKALLEGLIVMDDPESILRCTNKIYLAELLAANGMRTPKTLIIHPDNIATVESEIGFPCILKQPDSAFSKGVMKAHGPDDLKKKLKKLWTKSDLVIAQKFLPTPFDWRIGVLDRAPIFACKYHMAPDHWQIIKHESDKDIDGVVETVPLDQVPANVLAAALKSANLVGDGLYGVDLKEVEGEPYIIEINDNPNIDQGYEDKILGASLYKTVMSVFRERIERRKIRLHS